MTKIFRQFDGVKFDSNSNVVISLPLTTRLASHTTAEVIAAINTAFSTGVRQAIRDAIS